jgi:tRNA-splicing ligase RtcB
MIASIIKIGDYRYKIPASSEAGMLADGLVFANDEIIEQAQSEGVLNQVINVSKLKGIIKASMAMPDIHLGYGFAVGGVAAFDAKEGIISPGGVGFDINCGVRLIKTSLLAEEIKNKVPQLMHELSRSIPKGLGRKGEVSISSEELKEACAIGVSWAVNKGYGTEKDAYLCEEGGSMPGADPAHISERAFERGSRQLGSLGSGNHFVEVQRVHRIIDKETARVFGLFEGQVVIMIHTGSRGFGHQVATDYIRQMQFVGEKYGINIPDRQLASAPAQSEEAKRYYKAMACAMNFAWINRHIITHFTRKSFKSIFGMTANEMALVYDVAHNSAKLEKHIVDGKEIEAYVHRKGATRSFGPRNTAIPKEYRQTGQPVFIPGDMGRSSYVLAGTERAMVESFGSTCHGAGRLLSRSKAKKMIKGNELKTRLESQGITVVAGHIPSLSEEAPEAYKDVNKVVEVCHQAGLSSRVAQLKPMGVLKG